MDNRGTIVAIIGIFTLAVIGGIVYTVLTAPNSVPLAGGVEALTATVIEAPYKATA